MTSAPLILTEGAPGIPVTLSSAEYRALTDLGIITVTPTLTDGIYEVMAGRKVGAVAIGDRHLIVRPKITDLNRLLFLLGYAQNPDIWREESIGLTGADELLSGVAEAFARLATRAVEQGLLQGYRRISDTLPVLRGRVLAGEQMNRLFGLPVPIAVEYDDFTVDIAENQLLVMATLRLLMVPRVSEPARRLLRRLRRTLADVSVPPRGSMIPTWQPSRLNARYGAALRLAEIILAAESFEHHLGEVTVTGYMFDMWRIFEDFVTVALRESFNDLGWRCRIQASLYLDERRQVSMRPDLLCHHNGDATAVIDAKYKAERPDGFPNADLYQMLAYCIVLGLGHGHLVYAKGNEPVSTHTVQHSGVTIHCHALDLTLPPTELLKQIDELTSVMAAA
ncbi:5-methylcytosine-specific restriction enzyme subunit McrC [Mycolicibacterium rutilum]|uniref:5-methylcytosine-specific restriction enzyme subunit McrC n=1 Tax=Mycolicibacterium rutilum TaxID=370526 RepID=A0A1H6ILD6_MYCRU|nr:restriction endonuclease [Mycolicibacterium rutilum]SEH47773.1 5-methylcytosine-specific restriction enzyme subunit McrC [Mycolicibacterium rutilum]